MSNANFNLKQTTPTSSMFTMIEYSESEGQLKLTFKNGHIYIYHSVNKQTYDEMIKAASTGSYYNQYIKNKYNYGRAN